MYRMPNLIGLAPCAEGYRYEGGHSEKHTASNILNFSDNDKCSMECNNDENCVSYEYYGRQCRLFENNKLSTKSTSGFFHCTKIGNLLFSNFVNI